MKQDSRAHKTKWTVYFIRSRTVLRFDDAEEARHEAYMAGQFGPVALIAPIYQ